MVEEAEGTSVYLADADRVEKLLDIIMNTVDMPNTPCIRQAAANEIAQIEADLFEQMYPEEAAARKAKQEEAEKLEAEREQRRKEESEQEKEARKPAPQPRDTLAHPPPQQQEPVERRI